ncbi:hypothetical protein [Pedobacter sp.]|uniref:hypothetical protein n=1 Tax=Pedobacter sp. TaxID=1411316 RepID=UPI003C67A14E
MRSFLFSLGLFLAVLIFSCSQKQDYKQIRTEVVAVHDKVMKDADLAYAQRKVVDSIYRQPKSAGGVSLSRADSLNMLLLIAEIDKANHQMEEWMDSFEPDVSGKSDAASIAYFHSELKKIRNLDQHFRKVMVRSDHFLDSLKQGK